MRDKRYFFITGLITLVILGVGAFFWTSGTVELDQEETIIVDSTWILGEEDAPVTIDLYPDFT